MNIMEITGSLRHIRQKIKDQMEPLKKEFCQVLIPIMKKANFKQIIVTAYTPYFNDGDVCEYGIRDVVGVITDQFNEYQGYNGYCLGEEPTEEFPVTDDHDQLEFILTFLGTNVDVFEELFGEGLFVFKEDGTFVEDEWDHE